MSCREIGERMVTRDPDMTKLLDKLEARELSARARDERDRRVVIARITQGGRNLLDEITPALTRHIKGLFAHMEARRLAALNELGWSNFPAHKTLATIER